NGFLNLGLLRHSAGYEVNSSVVSNRSLLEMFVGFVKEPSVLDGQIDEIREWTERHGMPRLAAERAGDYRSTLPFFIARLRIFDGAAGLQINAGRPGDGRIGLGG